MVRLVFRPIPKFDDRFARQNRYELPLVSSGFTLFRHNSPYFGRIPIRITFITRYGIPSEFMITLTSRQLNPTNVSKLSKDGVTVRSQVTSPKGYPLQSSIPITTLIKVYKHFSEEKPPSLNFYMITKIDAN
ncbi:15350_t:CDS:2 [Acaulospora morrowiae]|uniref:15350_t:CDS:1 n=1 Tax=Acaulospora morrowiae TaxID=94023 RepID=A0A9N9E371_9GLOM|nr:15350_t:CDS:2 [Acaulospora morrowiae]